MARCCRLVVGELCTRVCRIPSTHAPATRWGAWRRPEARQIDSIPQAWGNRVGESRLGLGKGPSRPVLDQPLRLSTRRRRLKGGQARVLCLLTLAPWPRRPNPSNHRARGPLLDHHACQRLGFIQTRPYLVGIGDDACVWLTHGAMGQKGNCPRSVWEGGWAADTRGAVISSPRRLELQTSSSANASSVDPLAFRPQRSSSVDPICQQTHNRNGGPDRCIECLCVFVWPSPSIDRSTVN